MRLILILLSLSLLVGCLPPSQSQLRMETDLEKMKRHLARLEIEQADSSASGSASGDSQQRQVAELVAGLDNLRVEFQSINGRLDDLGRENQQLIDEVQLIQDDLGLQLGALHEQFDQLEQRTSELSEMLATATVAAAVVPAAATTEKEALSPEQLYQQALDLIRKEKRFVEGRKQLQQFVKSYPQHDLAVNALYWSGEALYGEQKYELAILQLQDVISQHNKHPKAAAAMYKQALAFNALGDRQNATTTMQKLIADYPDSEQVEKAKKFLQK